ncbi:TPA: LysE family transporter [Vibrio alginolyticus]|uniref:LysE family translocator n=2 Tax=Vibrio harveyi group TaxID=717610 RepID=UPI00063DC9DF|nr:LysE family transporter [Vibrio alginolyticus]EKK7180117.1 LysE family transporter [Vibrio alginolyticus]KLI70085.1 threonine transporter [Vibrio alginolyticus]MBT0115156.1 LysE family transporter [Vibrio alginolyticus]MDM4740804.1 LysE family transporter [Vibrio alginolyticus]MDM4761157.1 LysE family transporter [Vibrio alginolyticus]
MLEQYLFLLPIATLLLIGAMTPGPSFILVAQTAISKSRSEAMCISIGLGLGLGASTFAFIASMGLIALFDAVPEFYVAFKILGGLYLCYLGVKMWRASKSKVVSADAELTSKPAHFKAVVLGLATQLSNPKTAIVFSSVFAAMLPLKVPVHTTSILVVGVFVLNFSWYFLVSILLSSPKAQASYLRFKSYINKGSGVLMGSMGSKFVAESFKP